MSENVKLQNAIATQTWQRRTWGWDSVYPPTWPTKGLFINTTEKVLKQNDGTEQNPSWTLLLSGEGEIAALSILFGDDD